LSYDGLDRLRLAQYDIGDNNEAFTMDKLGNRESVNVRDGNDVNYAVDTLTNRYDSIGANSLEYDAAGNLIKDRDGYQYEYDYENRIVKILDDANNTVARFAYDTMGRRIRKSDCIADTNTLYYYNDKWQVLCEYDDSGYMRKWYVYGNYIDEVLMSGFRVTTLYYVHDHLYSPVAVTQCTGVVLERYEYDAYGQPTIWNADFTAQRDESSYDNPYYFTGRRLDFLDNGNLKLQINRHRYYDYCTGRWLTADGLGYIDSMNLYEYVISKPMHRMDPLGLGLIPPIIIGPPRVPRAIARWIANCCPDKCKKGDISYDILDRIITPYHFHPTWRGALRETRRISTVLTFQDVAEIAGMLVIGLSPNQIAIRIGRAVVTTVVVNSVERACNRFINEMARRMARRGNWAFLKVQVKRCKKESCCIIYRRYNWKKDKKTKYYQCIDGAGAVGIYRDPVDAAKNFSRCKNTFNNEFDDAKDDPRELRDLWF